MSDLKALFVLLAMFFFLGFFSGSKGFRVLCSIQFLSWGVVTKFLLWGGLITECLSWRGVVTECLSWGGVVTEFLLCGGLITECLSCGFS